MDDASCIFCVGSDSEPDDKEPMSPIVAGPPPPPLRGIPHLNPDAVDISDEPSRPQPAVSPPITTVLPSQSRPIPPRHLAVMDGFSVGDHQPQLHPVPLLSTPQSNFQMVLGPPTSPIQHGEAPLTNAHTPLSPVAPSPSHRKTSLTLQLGTKLTEGSISSPSLPNEHLFREPILVSPRGSHTPKSLSPVASPVTTTPVATTSAPSAPVQTDRKPPIPPAKLEVMQERSNDQLKAETESKEDSSIDSSEDSLTSEDESMDLQDEARDTFDTSK